MKKYKYANLENETMIVKQILEFDDINTMDGLEINDNWPHFISIKNYNNVVEVGMTYNSVLDTFTMN
jgi:hypothetical protein